MTPQQTIDSSTGGPQSFLDWLQRNTRAVSIGAVIVVVGAAGYWFYLRSGELKRANAERQLSQAKQSMSAGNQALAQTDLQRVATRYKGTPAGAQAALLLAQVEYGQGKHQEGLQALEPYNSAGAAGPMLSAVLALIGDGQLALGQAETAAATYRKAAESTKLPGETAVYMAKAGRALMAANKNDEAREIWERLATDPNALPVRNEAEVRLGELSAKPATKG